MNKTKKPQTTSKLLALLDDERAGLGKSGRRLADFLIMNPGDTALLTSAEVAQRCGVHASSVVRLAQGMGFSGYRELQALFQKDLSASIADARQKIDSKNAATDQPGSLRLHMLVDSGKSFNESARCAAESYCASNSSVTITTDLHVSHTLNVQDIARQIEESAAQADALILVAREHPMINGAVRKVIATGVPVVCLTTDLPSSSRTAYVGSDQYASGATAGWMCGRMLPCGEANQVLFVCSVPFRCHQEREQGFRQALRSEFPALSIEEKVSSDESIDVIYEAVRRYIVKNGPPAAIYNVSGANIGVGRALEDEGLCEATLFIGHELNTNSRTLLEQGTMDVAIGHDFDQEIVLSVECIKQAKQGIQPANRTTPSLLYTRYNCPPL